MSRRGNTTRQEVALLLGLREPVKKPRIDGRWASKVTEAAHQFLLEPMLRDEERLARSDKIWVEWATGMEDLMASEELLARMDKKWVRKAGLENYMQSEQLLAVEGESWRRGYRPRKLERDFPMAWRADVEARAEEQRFGTREERRARVVLRREARLARMQEEDPWTPHEDALLEVMMADGQMLVRREMMWTRGWGAQELEKHWPMPS